MANGCVCCLRAGDSKMEHLERLYTFLMPNSQKVVKVARDCNDWIVSNHVRLKDVEIDFSAVEGIEGFSNIEHQREQLIGGMKRLLKNGSAS